MPLDKNTSSPDPSLSKRERLTTKLPGPSSPSFSFRKIVLWLHLTAGLTAGVIIGIMSFTGCCLAFEKEIISWAERDAAHLAVPPAPATRLPLEDLLARAKVAQPDFRIASATIDKDPAAAIQLSAGREGVYYLNPYTGEMKAASALRTRAFLRTMNEWHRWLGTSEEYRSWGRAITGASTVVFLGLALSGFYLWWPRSWSWRGFRAIALVNFKLAGRARDWNWHNAVGFWCAPIFVVLTLTALPMSYRSANDFLFRLMGTPPPTQGAGGPGFADPAVDVPAPAKGARPLGYEALFARAREQMPAWETFTLRLGGGPRRGERREGTNGPSRDAESARAGGPRSLQAVSITVRESNAWPRTATTTLAFDPFTGEVLKREGFAEQTAGRRARTWTRFLHTGEAFGMVGKVVAALACTGAVVLVATGIILAFRRFFAPVKTKV